MTLTVLGLSGLVLGFVGWLERLDANSAGDVADAAYRTLGLFSPTGAPDPPLPWTLGLARFVVPIVAAWSSLEALSNLWSDRVQQQMLPFRSGHVIVAGLGDKGLAFTRSCRAIGHRVVVIEQRSDSPAGKAARSMGAIVLIGDARDRELLAAAGVERASSLLALTEDDGTNAEIVLTGRDLRVGTAAPIATLAHVRDAQLARLLRLDDLRRPQGQHLEFFNVEEHAARTLYARHLAGTEGVAARDHLVVVGFTPLTEAIVVTTCRERYRTGLAPLRLQIVGHDADDRWARLVVAVPHLAAAVSMSTIDALSALDLEGSTPALVVVDQGTDSATAEVAVGLREEARRSGATIVACLRSARGLGVAIDDTIDDGFSNLQTCAVIDSTCTHELMTFGTFELIAQMIHEEYSRSRSTNATQTPSPDDASVVPWARLEDSLKESNRSQARHIATKLRAIDCEIVPSDSWDAPDFMFTETEIEQLAVLEHDRWVAERTGNGWTLGPRNHERKTTPYLVSWAELDEDIRELDRAAVRNIPMQVQRAGGTVARRSVTP